MLKRFVFLAVALVMLFGLVACRTGTEKLTSPETTAVRYSLSLHISPSQGGSVTAVPEAGTDDEYVQGTEVLLTASPKPGYEFVRWEGDFPLTLSLAPEPEIVKDNPLQLTVSKDMTIFAIFKELTPTPSASDFEMIGRATQTLIVAFADGDYDKLSDALNSITDASETKRYAVLVIGKIVDTNQINAKSYVDVIGYGADIVVDTDSDVHALMMSSIREATWRDITVRRTGSTTGKVNVLRIYGNTDDTVRLEYSRFLNEVSNAADNNSGIVIFNEASPILVGCVGQAGPGNYSYGIAITGVASPTLYETTGIGGSGEYNCHGIICGQSAHPTLIGCIGKQGTGGIRCYGLPVIDQASPVMIGCLGTYQKFSTPWNYRPSNDGRFQPFAGKPYQLVSLQTLVREAATVGTTLNLGTTPGGSEIASGIRIDEVAYQFFEIKRVEIDADGWLYATPSAPIAGGSLTIYYSVVVNYRTCSAIYLRTEGYPVINNSTFLANGSSDALSIGSDVIPTKNWEFNNCHFETLDPANQHAVYATEPITDAPIRNCTFVGLVRNVTFAPQE